MGTQRRNRDPGSGPIRQAQQGHRFFLTEGTLDIAVAELHKSAALDLDDHLTFEVLGTPNRRIERPGQPGSELVTVRINCYAGAQKADTFTVDVVVSSVITQPPELLVPEPPITMRGIGSPTYQLYPVVDHIADKLCATTELHNGMPSSRHRDLVDLVVFARTRSVEAGRLREAIAAERVHRGLQVIDQWRCPDQWANRYSRMARDVVLCRDHRTFDAAVALMSDFFDPVLSGELNDSHSWDATELRWAEPDPPPV